MDGESEEFKIAVGVPQGSPLLPILYLFYVAELLDSYNNTADRLSASGFVDDTTLLAYGRSTESNCRTLSRAHDCCMKWARRYGASFAPDKYELIHLSRRPRGFNMQAQLQLGSLTKEPTSKIRVLEVWLDPQLRWGGKDENPNQPTTSHNCLHLGRHLHQGSADLSCSDQACTGLRSRDIA